MFRTSSVGRLHIFTHTENCPTSTKRFDQHLVVHGLDEGILRVRELAHLLFHGAWYLMFRFSNRHGWDQPRKLCVCERTSLPSLPTFANHLPLLRCLHVLSLFCLRSCTWAPSSPRARTVLATIREETPSWAGREVVCFVARRVEHARMPPASLVSKERWRRERTWKEIRGRGRRGGVRRNGERCQDDPEPAGGAEKTMGIVVVAHAKTELHHLA